MAEGIVRVVLSCIILIDYEIGYKIHQQPAVSPKPFFKELRQLILVQHILDHHIRANPKATASVRFGKLIRKHCFWKVKLVLLIGKHPGPIRRIYFSADRPFAYSILSLSLII